MNMPGRKGNLSAQCPDLFMIIILSPSKTQETGQYNLPHTLPIFLEQAEYLAGLLRELSAAEIAELMQISDKLAGTTWQRFQDFSYATAPQRGTQALLAFRGDVFSEIDVDNYGKNDFTFAQQHVRILSGLYGLLRPLDLIQPYRLEIGGKFKPKKYDSLYSFWRPFLSGNIENTCREEGHREVINLASVEYFKAIAPGKLTASVVNVYFKQQNDGKLRTIAIHAKKARGALTDYIIRNRLKHSRELTGFCYQGYCYAAHLSQPNELCFLRND